MWDIVDKNVAERREAKFKRDFWRERLHEAATTFRFDNHPCSAQTIIDSLLVKPVKLAPDDFVIAVMGPTGSGKTNFVNSVTGNPECRIALSKSGTHAVTPHSIYRDGLRIVLVDTPGFDDTYFPDGQILKIIAGWLMQEYPDGRVLRLAGIIYLHRITDNRMSDAAYKNLEMLGLMCGSAFLPQVHLVTTMWDIARDRNMAERKEATLKDDFWQVLLQGGATAFRFDDRPNSAWAVIQPLLDTTKNRKLLLLQEELVEQKKRLNETAAGIALFSRLQMLLREQRRTLKELADEANAQRDPYLAQSLQEEWDEINMQLHRTFGEMKVMNSMNSVSFTRRTVPFTRRTFLWLFGLGRNLVHAINLYNGPY